MLKENLTKTNDEEQRAAARARMLEINEAKGIEVTDINTKTTTTYNSIRKAAEAIGCHKNALHFNEKQQLKTGIVKPLKSIYTINVIRYK